MNDPDHQPPSPLASSTGVALSPAIWARILTVLERLALSSNLAEILSLINDSMRDCLDAERSSVFRFDAASGELVAEQAHGMNGQLRFPASTGLAGEAIRTRSIINVPDCYGDPRFNRGIDQQTGFQTRCMLSIPLMSLDGTLEGVAQVLNKRSFPPNPSHATHVGHNVSISPPCFTGEDEAIARALASQAAVAIRRASLIEAQRRKDKMEADLRVAREIQSATLPRELPTVPGYSVAADLIAAEETAGDCYDIIRVTTAASDHLWMFVADAAGHGVGPALAVSQAHAMFAMGVRAALPLATILGLMNDRLRESLPIGRFVCAVIAELDLVDHSLRYVAAGMSPIVRLRRGGLHHPQPAAILTPASTSEWDEFGSTHPPLGLEDALDGRDIATLSLNQGDALIIATDGVYEQLDTQGKPIGIQPVLRRAAACTLPGTSALMQSMLARVSFDGHPRSEPPSHQPLPRDDQTVIVLRRESDHLEHMEFSA